MYQDGMELMLTLALFLWSLDSSTKNLYPSVYY